MGEWQPIETAPRNLTEVLVYCDEGIVVAQFEMHAAPPFWSYDTLDRVNGREFEIIPTHWQPLPSPPATREPG